MMKFKSFLIVMVVFVALPSWAKDKINTQTPFLILSPAFESNADLPKEFTCDGLDINPPLEIYNPPAQTKSLAITVVDLDAPEGVWAHWVVFNIPPTQLSIARNTVPGVQLFNDFGNYAYAGPCPLNDKAHRMVFTAYALNSQLNLNEGCTVQDLQKAIRGRILAQAELKATYRKASF